MTNIKTEDYMSVITISIVLITLIQYNVWAIRTKKSNFDQLKAEKTVEIALATFVITYGLFVLKIAFMLLGNFFNFLASVIKYFN